MLWLLTTVSALAGSGPWSLSRGDHAVYFGLEAQRFRNLNPVANGEPHKVPTGGPVMTTGAKVNVALGLIDGVEAELSVPYYRVEAAVVEAGACRDFPGAACATTMGFGVIDLRSKWQFLDELGGSPISIAAGARARLGSHTQNTRDRITNLGEGTTDVGGFLSFGRTARLGKGFWNGYAEGGYLHRPATTTAPRGPNDELNFDALVHVAPLRSVGFGPAASGFWRPRGVDFDAVDMHSKDRLAIIRAANVRVGGEVVLRDPRSGLALSASFLRTVFARNNPPDTWILSTGVSAQNPLKRRARDDP